MTTRSQLIEGIEPGSVEHGKRADLESGLSAALPESQPSPQAVARQAVPAPTGGFDDPLGSLLNGQVTPTQENVPVTAGLSVGPGFSPAPQDGMTPMQQRLHLIASQAASPLLRAAARNRLRRAAGDPV
jgi:hypothetical protein